MVIGTGDAGAAAVREVCAEEGRELVWVSVGGGVRGDEHVRSWDQGRGELERILRREKWGVVVVDFMGFQVHFRPPPPFEFFPLVCPKEKAPCCTGFETLYKEFRTLCQMPGETGA